MPLDKLPPLVLVRREGGFLEKSPDRVSHLIDGRGAIHHHVPSPVRERLNHYLDGLSLPLIPLACCWALYTFDLFQYQQRPIRRNDTDVMVAYAADNTISKNGFSVPGQDETWRRGFG